MTATSEKGASMINTDLIQARMKALGLTQRAVAKESGINESALSLKMNNERPISLKEVERLQEVLLIPNIEIADYFLCKKGEQNADIKTTR